MDLLDLWRGALSPRKADVLIRGLPPDSATRTAMNGEPEWSTTDHLLAALVDAVNGLAWLTRNKDLPKRHHSKPPQPIPRPKAPGEEAPKKTITHADLLDFRERTTRR